MKKSPIAVHPHARKNGKYTIYTNYNKVLALSNIK